MGRDLFVAVDPCLSSLRALALSYYTEQKSLFSHQMRAHDLDLGHRRQHPVQMLSYHPRPIGSPQKQSPREPFCLLQEFWAIVLNFPVQITGDFFQSRWRLSPAAPRGRMCPAESKTPHQLQYQSADHQPSPFEATQPLASENHWVLRY